MTKNQVTNQPINKQQQPQPQQHQHQQQQSKQSRGDWDGVEWNVNFGASFLPDSLWWWLGGPILLYIQIVSQVY